MGVLCFSFTTNVFYSYSSLSATFGKKKTFYDKLYKLLKLCDFNKEVILIGDLNVNWLDKTGRKKLKNITSNFDLKQLVKGPTRIARSSKTQIDLIFTNKPDYVLKTFNMITGLSDHNNLGSKKTDKKV